MNTDHANKGARWKSSNRFHCEDKVILHLEHHLIVWTFAKTTLLQKTKLPKLEHLLNINSQLEVLVPVQVPAA